ncbi:ABC transporter ATP-binding protein [uncultured Bifidobacterium sp.]|uniref:ABC transporter ATP-binding protein n=1 Tax=uncultured Bifidobacterium sp. TaxID=165187 RepID=UPI0028DB9F1C|nr:ABC transporter ATP-binding protein [uncultured Bifidobacterium sp.]
MSVSPRPSIRTSQTSTGNRPFLAIQRPAPRDATESGFVLRARGLSKAYGGRLAVNGVDVDVRRGALTALIGPNGAGKSTIISMLVGLLQPTAGTVRAPACEPRIGIVFQNGVLDPTLTVRENLAIRSRLGERGPRARVDEVIRLVGADDFARQRYGTLSGGQRRRVDIARALLTHPDLLVLDEPTTGLDIGTRRSLWGLLHGLRRDEGMSILLTTHYLEEARNADDVIVLDRGRIIEQGTAADLVRRFGDHAVILSPGPGKGERLARLIAADPRWSAHVRPVRDLGRASSAAHDVKHSPDDESVEVDLDDPHDCLALLDAVQGLAEDFEVRRGTMDDVFLAITERARRTSRTDDGSMR